MCGLGSQWESEALGSSRPSRQVAQERMTPVLAQPIRQVGGAASEAAWLWRLLLGGGLRGRRRGDDYTPGAAQDDYVETVTLGPLR